MINLHKFDKKCSLWYNVIVRVIRGYGKMKGYVLEYVCENEFKKLERALKKYNMLAFKKLNFDYYPALRNGNFVGELISVNKKIVLKLMNLNYQVIRCLLKFMVKLN